MKLLVTLSLIVVFSCRDIIWEQVDANCSFDPLFEAQFTNCLFIVNQARFGVPVDFRDRMNAIECLEAITGLESAIMKHSDSPYLLYPISKNDSSKDIFEAEYRQWITWFVSNRCNYTITNANEAIAQKATEIGDEVSWPSSFERLTQPIKGNKVGAPMPASLLFQLQEHCEKLKQMPHQSRSSPDPQRLSNQRTAWMKTIH